MVFLDLTIITFGWNFDLSYLTFLNVVWAIGVSMIVLAALIQLPMPAIIGFGVFMVVGHNLLDGVSSDNMSGAWALIWQILHEQGFVELPLIRYFVIYPLIPWFGVMALGYAMGVLYTKAEVHRNKKLLVLGMVVTALFFVVRGLNGYGDPAPWSRQQTILSFFNTTKYPASLDFLLMTLGPALILLGAFEKLSGTFARVMIVFGRVPLFFYVIHIYFIHLLAVFFGLLMGFPVSEMTKSFGQYPETWGFGLFTVYLIWLGVVGVLYPACKWFSNYKHTSRKAWLSLF